MVTAHTPEQKQRELIKGNITLQIISAGIYSIIALFFKAYNIDLLLPGTLLIIYLLCLVFIKKLYALNFRWLVNLTVISQVILIYIVCYLYAPDFPASLVTLLPIPLAIYMVNTFKVTVICTVLLTVVTSLLFLSIDWVPFLVKNGNVLVYWIPVFFTVFYLIFLTYYIISIPSNLG